MKSPMDVKNVGGSLVVTINLMFIRDFMLVRPYQYKESGNVFSCSSGLTQNERAHNDKL